MFENIHLVTYQFTTSFSSQEKSFLARPDNPLDTPIEFLDKTQEEIENATKDLGVYFSGNMETFFRSPLPAFVLQNLYHIQSFSVFTCDARSFTRRSDFDSYLILYTYEGNGILEYENQTYHLASGDGFFIDCKKNQFYKTEGTLWKYSALHINGPLLPELYPHYLQSGSPVFTQPPTGSYQTLLEQLLLIYDHKNIHRDWQASDCISHIITNLLGMPRGTSKNISGDIPENIQYLIKYMESNYTSPLSLDFLAEFAGLSKYHLSRVFKKYTGFSPNDYLIQLRLEHARDILLSTTLPASKISHMVGIHDINNFINLFHKKMGLTPGEYRKKIAGK